MDARTSPHEPKIALRNALAEMIYEATHLSPAEGDGSHWYNISDETLSRARDALKSAYSGTETILRRATLKYHVVDWLAEGKIVVRFPDGSTCDAVPHDTPHYHVIAHRCGYGDDIWLYAFEHEVMHALVEEWFHDRPSQVLTAVASGKMLSGKKAAYEESMAQVVQKWVRANERPILGGVEWDALKIRALEVLGSGPINLLEAALPA